ncbi:hypothetical protein [Desulfatibacillum aliphaticivorans]|uniref:hypothetical protein n=1 Tax=Desulfatibacillum aliphaticivorans TaxID=218208 RepID=UPI00041D32BA|nr:hypothetical protein [Desulfatibacillum aliphaticivorans]
MNTQKTAARRLSLSRLALFACVFAICFTAPSFAHNLWIVGDPHNNGDGVVDLYFEHWLGPGDGAYTGPILERGKTTLRTPDGNTISLTMKSASQGENKKYLSANAGKTPQSYAVDHASLYGIYHGRLDFFYGKCIQAKTKKDLEALAESQNLPFQFVPQVTEDGKLLLKLQYFSNPLPKTKIKRVKKDGTEETFETDKKGEFLFTPDKAGKYHFSSLAFEHEAAGAFEYQAFKGIMYGTTLTINWPVE